MNPEEGRRMIETREFFGLRNDAVVREGLVCGEGHASHRQRGSRTIRIGLWWWNVSRPGTQAHPADVGGY